MHDDVGPIRCERTRQFAAEAVSGAGDQHSLALVGQRCLGRLGTDRECYRQQRCGDEGKRGKPSHGSISIGRCAEHSPAAIDAAFRAA